LFFLQDAQEFALQLGRILAHLVEESVRVRRFESAGPVLDRAGERAFGVAEEFALVKLARDRRAIDADERLLAAAAALVDFAGDQFLAGARFARISTAASVGATRSICRCNCLRLALWPMMSPRALASRTSSRR